MALAFTPEAEREFERILHRYPNRRAALIPVLTLADHQFGYLSREAMEYVAGRLELPTAWVLNTATFYTMLRKRPTGRFHLQVCVNVACYLKGADALVEHLRQRLGIGFGEITPDGLFSIEGVQCLASCGTAPTIQVNDEYHESMTVPKMDALLETLRAQAAQAPAATSPAARTGGAA
jgi:NADH-quinone oxidoreductase E subunit